VLKAVAAFARKNTSMWCKCSTSKKISAVAREDVLQLAYQGFCERLKMGLEFREETWS